MKFVLLLSILYYTLLHVLPLDPFFILSASSLNIRYSSNWANQLAIGPNPWPGPVTSDIDSRREGSKDLIALGHTMGQGPKTLPSREDGIGCLRRLELKNTSCFTAKKKV